MYIYQRPNWPVFTYDPGALEQLLGEVRFAQGLLLGRAYDWGFDPRLAASAEMTIRDVITNSKIEGEDLPVEEVRSSVASRLGLPNAGLSPASREVDGVVEMMLDATINSALPLSSDRLSGWHSLLFPSGKSGPSKIVVGSYRKHPDNEPMQVICGTFGRPKVHFEAPPSGDVPTEMGRLITYFNEERSVDPLLKAGIVHLWFLAIHPYDDGNGRIARALTDMSLTQTDGARQRFYSLSSAILDRRKQYYRKLEAAQKGSLDVTEWLSWFLATIHHAIIASEEQLGQSFARARFWKRHTDTPLNDRQRLILRKLWEGYQGKLTSFRYANLTEVSQDTATRDINDLVGKGILVRSKAGGRSTAYMLSSV